MRHVFSSIAILLLTSFTFAGDIEGTVVKPSGRPFSADHPAVVWVEGLPSQIVGKREVVMAQRGGQFVPSFVVVVAGETVNMPNEDEVAHNVHSNSAAKQFDLGYYAKGDIRTVTFDRPGVVDVVCLIHSFMRARILVVSNSHYAVVAEDGSFRIRNLPPGKFSLAIWADGMTPFTQEVVIPESGKPVHVRLSWPTG